MSDVFPISGNIDPQSFPFILTNLHRHGATGSLKVQGPSYQKALYFRAGRILFASSNDPRDQLGAILIESGKITPEQFEEVNANVGPGNPLAKALADSGFVSQRELGEAARAKVERILSDVIAYATGSFEFEDGVLPKGAVDLRLSTERAFLAAARRVSDRNFVLRHLESLDVVLVPTAALDSRLPEFQAEAGGLPERLDGRRSLKEAAALTRLDEFEAAKVACALFFLGLVERAPVARAADEFSAFAAKGSKAEELDLSQTARLAVEAESPAPAFSIPPPAGEPAPPAAPWREAPPPAVEVPPVPHPDVRAAAEPGGPMGSDVSRPEPQVSWDSAIPPSSPAAAPPGETVSFSFRDPSEPTRWDQGPLTTREPGADPAEIEIGASPPRKAAPPFEAEKPTARLFEAEKPGPKPFEPERRAQPRFERERPVRRPSEPDRPFPRPLEPESPAPASSRPSEPDLAALDTLLGSSSPEGPLVPLEKPERAGEWEPQFTGAPSPAPAPTPTAPRSRGLAIALGASALALLGAVALGYYFYYLPGRGAQTARGATVASPAPPPVSGPADTPSGAGVAPAPSTLAASPLLPIPTSAPSAASTVPAIRMTPAPVSTASVPPPQTPAPSAAPPVSRGGPAPSLAEARRLLRRGELPQAARGFAANFKAASAGARTIQLLVACSADTVRQAVQNVQAEELYIVPVEFRGRSCYRLGWGVYDSEARAESALRTVPSYFRKGGATPKVVPVAGILP